MTHTLTLTEAEVNNLYMALELATQAAITKEMTSAEGEIRHNVALNQKAAFIELGSKVLKIMDSINADRI